MKRSNGSRDKVLAKLLGGHRYRAINIPNADTYQHTGWNKVLRFMKQVKFVALSYDSNYTGIDSASMRRFLKHIGQLRVVKRLIMRSTFKSQKEYKQTLRVIRTLKSLREVSYHFSHSKPPSTSLDLFQALRRLIHLEKIRIRDSCLQDGNYELIGLCLQRLTKLKQVNLFFTLSMTPPDQKEPHPLDTNIPSILRGLRNAIELVDLSLKITNSTVVNDEILIDCGIQIGNLRSLERLRLEVSTRIGESWHI